MSAERPRENSSVTTATRQIPCREAMGLLLKSSIRASPVELLVSNHDTTLVEGIHVQESLHMIETEISDRRSPAATRRQFLRRASAIAIAGAATQLVLPSNVASQDARVAQDLAVLNYALILELLESDFYVRGLQRFGASDFAPLGTTLFDRLRDIRDHETAHVQILTTTVRNYGGAPETGGLFQFPYTDVASFLRVAQVLENTGVSAYDGAVALLKTPQLQTAGATIATVEARHASYLNLINGDNPFPAATDIPRSPGDIVAAIQPFVKTSPVPSR